MWIPQTGELACVVALAFTGIFAEYNAGLIAGVGLVLAAMRWRD
jgi:hypothetical protein